MANRPYRDGGYNFGDNENSNGSFKNQHTDEIEDIMKNINQKAMGKRFELNIADKEFYQIPDVEYKSHRYKEMEQNISEGDLYERNSYAPSNVPPPPGEGKRKNNKRSNNGKNKRNQKGEIKRTGVFGGVVYALCVTGVSIVLAVVLLQAVQDFLGLWKEEAPLSIVVDEGDSLKDVSKELEHLGVIKQPFTFEIYTKYKEKVESVDPGEFNLNKNMSYDEIISALHAEDESGVVTLQLLEGRSIFEYAKQLEEAGVCTAESLFEALDERAKNPVYDWEKWDMAVPDSTLRYTMYEGYFFPNTHEFYLNEKPSSVIKRFLDDFDNMLTIDMRNRAQDLGMTIDQLVTLASILEKEAAGSSETSRDLEKVSAVFHNRLDNPDVYPKLQSDVTVDYVNNFITPNVSDEEREGYAAAYSTYKTDGLPIGPICNPGKDALHAVLYPEEGFGGIYFFVTDINNKFYYGKTNAEHEFNISIAESVSDDKGETSAGGLAIGNEEEQSEE